MLLFEFVGALFQFEQREPEFAPLFQLPPSRTALLPIHTFSLHSLDPTSYHAPCLRKHR